VFTKDLLRGLNPTLDRSFHGENVHQGVILSPNAKFSYDLTRKVAAGVEYYGSVGPVTGFDPLSNSSTRSFLSSILISLRSGSSISDWGRASLARPITSSPK
jgi:hypothetical protein